MSADSQFKSYIDRILRCREAEDGAKADTKAVYAEMKAEGYDKTIAGKLVAELRSREKNSDKVDEQESLLELYRDAYHRASGTVVATHVHARDTYSSRPELSAGDEGSLSIPREDARPSENGVDGASVTSGGSASADMTSGQSSQALTNSHQASSPTPVAGSVGSSSAGPAPISGEVA